MKKDRDRFRRRRQVKRQVVAAVVRCARSDPRVFAEFTLGGRQMRSLLDSGATVSLLGRRCRKLAEDLNLPEKPYVSTVRNASGEDRSIIGRSEVPVEYKDVVGSEVLVVAAIDGEQGTAELIAHCVNDDGVKSEPEAWVLEEGQKLILEEVKAKFLAFEKVGLGKTHAGERSSLSIVASGAANGMGRGRQDVGNRCHRGEQHSVD
ncbi:hypothetical protein ACLKA7_012125 [Drosophila subpalustris]